MARDFGVARPGSARQRRRARTCTRAGVCVRARSADSTQGDVPNSQRTISPLQAAQFGSIHRSDAQGGPAAWATGGAS
jgi:hypothetical protein